MEIYLGCCFRNLGLVLGALDRYYALQGWYHVVWHQERLIVVADGPNNKSWGDLESLGCMESRLGGVGRGHDERAIKKDQMLIFLDGRMFGLVDGRT